MRPAKGAVANLLVLAFLVIGWLPSAALTIPAGPATVSAASSTTPDAVVPSRARLIESAPTSLTVSEPAARGLELQAAFAAAAREFDVPESILLAVAYNESRWETHDGQPSTDGGYGVMHLTDAQPADGDAVGASADPVAHPDPGDPSQHTLLAAAELIGHSPDTLKRDPVQNIRGGAALLAQYAREVNGMIPPSEADWYGAVAKYRGTDEGSVARDFADTVFATIRSGASRITTDGQVVTLVPANISPNTRTAAFLPATVPSLPGVECPAGLVCDFNPAYPRNYNPANRPANGIEIRYIVIHDTEEPYANAIRTFQDPRSYASAQYLIRSADGHVTQLVSNRDVGHHAGNWYFNSHSIGIEHEGHAAQGATWFSEQLYQSSAKLVRYLAGVYHVPLDRAHIIGHDNVPAQTPAGQSRMHWDPGPFWDWAHYMDLLGAPLTATEARGPGDIVTILPRFATNLPTVSDCNASGCHDLSRQPANFVYLRTAPRPDAPLIGDPALTRLQPSPGQGTTRIDDWGDRAVTGQRFYRIDRQGDWDAIYFAGQKAWFYNPGHDSNTVPGSGTVITPRAGKTSIPVYGTAFPDATSYPAEIEPAPATPLQYVIPAGQLYVATDLVRADYLDPRDGLTGTLRAAVRGTTTYYQIFFGYRLAFVRADDVQVVAR